MDEATVFPEEAADVAMQAIKDGVARVIMTRKEAFEIARRDIEYARNLEKTLMDTGYIPEPPKDMLQHALDWAIEQVS